VGYVNAVVDSMSLTDYSVLVPLLPSSMMKLQINELVCILYALEVNMVD
jgi:hypothetical protein